MASKKQTAKTETNSEAPAEPTVAERIEAASGLAV